MRGTVVKNYLLFIHNQHIYPIFRFWKQLGDILCVLRKEKNLQKYRLCTHSKYSPASPIKSYTVYRR